jgi:CheY-like chemotaxis protein
MALVALTAMSGVASARRIEAAGFDLHLVKPVDPFTLVGVVDKFVQARTAGAPRRGDPSRKPGVATEQRFG